MKAIRKKITIIFFLCLSSSALFAQSFSNVGSAGANFLKIPVEPIGAALGNSNVATNEGILGLYWNPGALAYTDGTEILLSQVNWIADTRLSFAGIAHNIGIGTIGLSLTALTMGEMEITTETSPEGTGNYFNSGSYAVGLSYGMKIIDRFSFGGTVKYVYEYIWETNGSTFLFDLGSIYQTDFYNMRIGMRLANFGGNVTFAGTPIDKKPEVISQSGISYSYDPRLERVSPEYSVPQVFNVGISIDPMNVNGHKITLTAAVNDPNDNNSQLAFGSEYNWEEMLFLRVGYKSGYDEQNISAGLGVKMNVGGFTPQLDFAYSAFGKLGSVLFLSVRLGM